MIRRIYEVDPLVCEYGAEMKVIAFIIEHAVIRRILGHIRGREKGGAAGRRGTRREMCRVRVARHGTAG